MIHIPKKVKIGPHEYIVKELNGDEQGDFWGRHSLEDREIRIKKDMGEPQLGIIYLHEILHAIDEAHCGKSLEEEQIHALSYGLYDFLTNNKIFDK